MKSEIKPSRRKKGSQGGMCFADVVNSNPGNFVERFYLLFQGQ